MPRNRFYQFTNGDLKSLRQTIPELEYIAPDISGWSGNVANNTIRNDKKGNFKVKGSSPEMNQVAPVEVLDGRFINDFDIQKRRKVVTIGPRVVELMYDEDEDPIGTFLKINGIFFKVVGTVKPLSNNFGNRDDMIQMPYTTLQWLYKRGDKFYSFIATAKIGESVEDLEGKIFEVLARRHNIDPTDKEAVGHFNIAKMFKKISGLFTSIGFLFWVIGFGVLTTGVIGVSNIMHVVVKERTKEIGIKRAIGARPFSIVGQIISEAVFLTTIFGFVGLVLGVFIVEGIGLATAGNPSTGILNPYVDIKVAFLALGILVVFGVLAGLLPAQRAMRVKPVDALRYE